MIQILCMQIFFAWKPSLKGKTFFRDAICLVYKNQPTVDKELLRKKLDLEVFSPSIEKQLPERSGPCVLNFF